MSRYEVMIRGLKKTVSMKQVQHSGIKESYLFTFEEDHEAQTLFVLKRESNSIVVSINNRVYYLQQQKRTPNSVSFISNGREIKASFPSATLRERVQESSGADVASVNEIVITNFPAKVVSIKASKGATLKEGDTLLILEAMKMEAQVKVPRNCILLDLFVSEGVMVSRGARLAQLRFD